MIYVFLFRFTLFSIPSSLKSNTETKKTTMKSMLLRERENVASKVNFVQHNDVKNFHFEQVFVALSINFLLSFSSQCSSYPQIFMYRFWRQTETTKSAKGNKLSRNELNENFSFTKQFSRFIYQAIN